MSKAESKGFTLVPSVLDRLIDDRPGALKDPVQNVAQLFRDLKNAVRRDLENLLNTRWRCTAWPPHLTELEQSLVNYGIPDFTSSELRAAEDPDALLRTIELAIRRFEPRLKHVRVEPLPGDVATDRALRFRIDATLSVDPVEDRVLFSSRLEQATGNFQVE